MTYKDKTFCASPNCKNVCGRQMSEEEKCKLKDWEYVSYAYFCDAPICDDLKKEVIDE